MYNACRQAFITLETTKTVVQIGSVVLRRKSRPVFGFAAFLALFFRLRVRRRCWTLSDAVGSQAELALVLSRAVVVARLAVELVAHEMNKCDILVCTWQNKNKRNPTFMYIIIFITFL